MATIPAILLSILLPAAEPLTSIQLSILAAAQSESNAGAVIEGDPSLVDVVLAAQKTNVATATQGSLDAEIEFSDDSERITGTVSLVWNERGAVWDYNVATARKLPAGESPPTEVEGKIIREGKRFLQFMSYSPRASFAAITQPEISPVRPHLQILPADLWYQVGATTPFATMLDPSFNSEVLNRYVIRKDDDQIVIQRHYTGGYLEFRISTKHNNNVVSYDEFPKAGDAIWSRGRFDWTQNSAGDWYVESLRIETSFPPGPRGTERFERILAVSVASYDARPEIAADQFSISAFQFPPGTKIEERGPDGKLLSERKIPIPKKRAVSDEEFSDLAETLRQGRFIRGKK